MRGRLSLTAFILMAGFNLIPLAKVVYASPDLNNTDNYRVLAGEERGLNISVIERLLEEGDEKIAQGDLVEARQKYDKAREISKQLWSFYRDIGGAFRGLDARIPKEMESKGRRSLDLLADANLRLAALFRRQNDPEVAVPLLVEVVRLLTPTSPQGQKAFQSLVELGFVDTPYAAR